MKSLFKIIPGIVPAGLLCLASAVASFAGTTNVIVGSPLDRFTPAIVTVNTGDSVIWSWAAAGHSTTSGTNGAAGDDNGVPCGLWDSGTTNAPYFFTNTFTSAGNFSYYCKVHFAFGMTGSVIVNSSGNLSPTVSITSPSNNATFSAPANVTIQVTASESGGSVTNVQFLVGTRVLTNEISPPFSATTNNLAANTYTLSAIAADSSGVTATNSISINVVTPVTVSLTNSAKLSPTNFQFSYLVNTGLSYVVQFSTNLAAANWIPLVTNVALSNPVVFVDNHATNTPGFYRVGRLSNP